MDALKSLVSPIASGLNTGAIGDGVKLLLLGSTVETARRVSMSAWTGFVDSFFLTAHFTQDDYPYDWLMHWLAKQPAYSRSREFEITTRSAGHNLTNSVNDLDIEDDEEAGDNLLHGRRRRTVAFLPSLDTTHTIYYRGHWLRITRTRNGGGGGWHSGGMGLKISVIARSNDILKRLVLEAKRDYERDAEHRVHIFLGDTTYGSWRFSSSRQKRPLSSIVLQPGVKDMLVGDTKDFLSSEEWYADRGIPFRRGYLLHGVPGSGKTSLIHSLAGELGLDIYVVSLSGKGMSDNMLANLMSCVPSRCVVLLEDLDAAFTRSLTRDSAKDGKEGSTTTGTPPADTTSSSADGGSTLSLSGLLNALDGVAASEGRLLFATTNHIERLDPALSRPGRMDVWVNFTNATRWQAEGIFKCFFPSSAPAPSPSSPSPDTPPTSGSEKLVQGLADHKSKKSSSARSKILGPALSLEELDALAKRFSAAIPEDELSVAALQGYLLKNKTRPRECVDEVAEWVKSEREMREKLKKEKEKKEKEELEKREKEEKEEKEKKEKAEKEEKEKKDKEELELKEKEKKEREEREAKEKQERKDARKAKKAAKAAAAASSSTSTSTPSATPVTETPPPTTEATPAAPTPAPTTTVTVTADALPTPEPSSGESSEAGSSGVEADTESSGSEVEGAVVGEKKKEKWVSVKKGSTGPAPVKEEVDEVKAEAEA